jgi:hypothetical protein
MSLIGTFDWSKNHLTLLSSLKGLSHEIDFKNVDEN